ncbi:dihydroneopterin aldolase [Brevundimonas pishanensis]|uniref:dihydroneopterin aldolase n=1 Tax=Brevundimonas pishanensis TaxID=2896315 RepID=UPI001FA6D92D|nr:dihydroneopterin aldolase [Brevundimonas pishanensis]
MTDIGSGAGVADWRTAPDQVRVFLKDVVVDLSVGLHPWERHPERPTRLVINVEMFADWPLPDGGFINYDHVRTRILGWAGRPHVELLETLAEEVISACFELPQVQACRVQVAKPQVFNEASGAGVELFCRRPQV